MDTLTAIIVVLLLLWLLGLLGAYTFGGLIHLLLIIALVLIIYRLVKGQRVL